MFKTKGLMFLVLVFLLAMFVPLTSSHTIEFETTQVTEADIALSPDGKWLVFTILGHLFRLPIMGGTAEQLTFGPYYDTDPAVSPDGNRVAFASNRDSSEGNIFVLELATRKITRVTHEPWAGRPTWTPNGQSIVYLCLLPGRRYCPTGQALVRRIPFGGEEPVTLSSPPRVIRSIFHLPDGRLAWTEVEPPDYHIGENITRIEVMSTQGTVSALRTIDGIADRIVASPSGNGLYCRRRLPTLGDAMEQPEELLFLPLPKGKAQQIIALSATNCVFRAPQIAAASDKNGVYLCEVGRLWKISPPSGDREHIPFNAKVKLEIKRPVKPIKLDLISQLKSVESRSVMTPRLLPDNRTLVFMALGYLWKQDIDGGPAERLFEGDNFEWQTAISPDGSQLAYVVSKFGDEIRVFDFKTGKNRSLASGDIIRQLKWSLDGKELICQEINHSDHSYSIVKVNVSDGKKEKVTGIQGRVSQPQISADGKFLYYTLRNTFYRQKLDKDAKKEALTTLESIWDAIISPDEKWIAFRQSSEIWVAPLSTKPVKEEKVRRLSTEGGTSFAFTSDGSAVIYSAGNRVWLQPITGNDRKEVTINLEPQPEFPSPMLVRNVHVLDLERGEFGTETSLYIEKGMIRWIGSEKGKQLPEETIILDARGRYAIPGLFDMHTHTGVNWLTTRTFLAYGVTSVRDLDVVIERIGSLADRSNITGIALPRYFYSGIIFTGPSAVENEKKGRRYVRLYKDWGAQFLKIYPTLKWSIQKAMAEEAQRVGLPVVGHGLDIEEITKGVKLGFSFLEHSQPNHMFDDVIQMMIAAGTCWTPTLAIGEGLVVLIHDEPERLLDEKLKAFFPKSHITADKTYMKTVNVKTLRGMFVEVLDGIQKAHRRGVKVFIGTDAGNIGIFPGLTVHWEMEFFVKAGLEPIEVIRIATQKAAVAVGVGDDLGTLEPGKLADMILLNANPMEEIKNTQTIWRVIKGGWVFDPEKLKPETSESSKK